jgi:hypothetical protein
MIEIVYDYIYELIALIIILLLFAYLTRMSRKISRIEEKIGTLISQTHGVKEEVEIIREYAHHVSRDTSFIKGALRREEDQE